MLVASLLGWPAPMLPIQLLWIKLVTDGLPALALEPPEPGLMNRPPRRAGEADRQSVLCWIAGSTCSSRSTCRTNRGPLGP